MFCAVLQLGGGYVFGLLVGFAADSLGSTAGATAAFIVGKTVKKSCALPAAKMAVLFVSLSHERQESNILALHT